METPNWKYGIEHFEIEGLNTRDGIKDKFSIVFREDEIGRKQYWLGDLSNIDDKITGINNAGMLEMVRELAGLADSSNGIAARIHDNYLNQAVGTNGNYATAFDTFNDAVESYISRKERENVEKVRWINFAIETAVGLTAGAFLVGPLKGLVGNLTGSLADGLSAVAKDALKDTTKEVTSTLLKAGVKIGTTEARADISSGYSISEPGDRALPIEPFDWAIDRRNALTDIGNSLRDDLLEPLEEQIKLLVGEDSNKDKQYAQQLAALFKDNTQTKDGTSFLNNSYHNDYWIDFNPYELIDDAFQMQGVGGIAINNNPAIIKDSIPTQEFFLLNLFGGYMSQVTIENPFDRTDEADVPKEFIEAYADLLGDKAPSEADIRTIIIDASVANHYYWQFRDFLGGATGGGTSKLTNPYWKDGKDSAERLTDYLTNSEDEIDLSKFIFDLAQHNFNEADRFETLWNFLRVAFHRESHSDVAREAAKMLFENAALAEAYEYNREYLEEDLKILHKTHTLGEARQIVADNLTNRSTGNFALDLLVQQDKSFSFSKNVPYVGGTGEYFVGTEEVDILAGTTFRGDTLEGHGNTDILKGGGGSDLLRGGSGDDYLYGEDHTEATSIFGSFVKNDTLEGGDGNDILDGGDGDDLLEGGEGKDTLRGGSGIDDLRGRNGNDSLDGGAGNDSLWGGDGNDFLYGGDGNDSLYGYDGSDLLNGGNGNDLLRGRNGDDSLLGQLGNDTVEGHSGNDVLNGGNGHDLLDGGEGSDTLYGGSGNDSLYGYDGNDLLRGGNGSDLLQGGNGNDNLVGESGSDRLQGHSGNDTLDGGLGDDSLDGGSGVDTVSYSFYSGETIVDLNSGQVDLNRGSSGSQTVKSIENVIGAQGDDQIIGNSANNLLVGGAGSDYLYGGAGDDTLIGGDRTGQSDFDLNQQDILVGGPGRDVFILAEEDTHFYSDGAVGSSTPNSYALISSFEKGADRIELKAGGLFNSSRYRLIDRPVQQGSVRGVGIYLDHAATYVVNPLIGIVEGFTASELTLTSTGIAGSNTIIT
ncbi:MAG: calcium-binding protein [Cyanophyceae cyanobacterium]